MPQTIEKSWNKLIIVLIYTLILMPYSIWKKKNNMLLFIFWNEIIFNVGKYAIITEKYFSYTQIYLTMAFHKLNITILEYNSQRCWQNCYLINAIIGHI